VTLDRMDTMAKIRPARLSMQVRALRRDQAASGQNSDKNGHKYDRLSPTVTSCSLPEFWPFLAISVQHEPRSHRTAPTRQNTPTSRFLSILSILSRGAARRPGHDLSQRQHSVQLTRSALTSGLKRFLSAPSRQDERNPAKAHCLDRAAACEFREGPRGPGGCPQGQGWLINLREAGSAGDPAERTSFRHSHPGSFRTALPPSPDRWPVTQDRPHSGRSARFSRAP